MEPSGLESIGIDHLHLSRHTKGHDQLDLVLVAVKSHDINRTRRKGLEHARRHLGRSAAGGEHHRLRGDTSVCLGDWRGRLARSGTLGKDRDIAGRALALDRDPTNP